MKIQKFTVTVVVNDKDGCGNPIPPVTEGSIRRAILNGLDTYIESVVVDRASDDNIL